MFERLLIWLGIKPDLKCPACGNVWRNKAVDDLFPFGGYIVYCKECYHEWES